VVYFVFLLDFRNVPAVWYILLFILLVHVKRSWNKHRQVRWRSKIRKLILKNLWEQENH